MSNQKPRAKKVNVQVPPDLEPIYVNVAFISHSPSEVFIDFACLLPNTPEAKVKARIVNTPTHAKLLLRALQENLERYEARFGEINLPSGGDDLASQFFGGVKPPES
jgi:hypothetical protein